MTATVLTGTKDEIARKLASLDGEVRQAIVFVNEVPTAPHAFVPQTVEELFSEMEPYATTQAHVDDSREAIYQRMEQE